MIFINIYSRFFAKFEPLEDTNIIERQPTPEEFIKKSEALEHYKELLDKIDLLQHIIELQPSQRNSGKYIEYLHVVQNLINNILDAGILSLNIEYKQKIVAVLQQLLQSGNFHVNISSLNSPNVSIGNINRLKTSIKDTINNGIARLEPLNSTHEFN